MKAIGSAGTINKQHYLGEDVSKGLPAEPVCLVAPSLDLPATDWKWRLAKAWSDFDDALKDLYTLTDYQSLSASR
jgi:hypothetical protein